MEYSEAHTLRGKGVLESAQERISSEALQRVFDLKHPAEEILEVKVSGVALSKKTSMQLIKSCISKQVALKRVIR